MVVIGERTLQCMSVVIGVCGTNFCTLLSDGRRVTNVNGGGIEPIDEDFQKILQINPRVLIGVGGWFDREEDVLGALDGLVDREHASVKIIKNTIASYCKQMMREHPMPRTYIVGGKEHDGTFVLYEFRCDVLTGRVMRTERRPDRAHNFALSISLPLTLTSEQDQILSAVGKAVTGSRTHGDMVGNVSGVIKEIAKREDSVNDNIKTLSVF